jgi:hypothetical protein
VVVFRVGVTARDAKVWLKLLAPVLDESYFGGQVPPIHEFDRQDEGPVWYIP